MRHRLQNRSTRIGNPTAGIRYVEHNGIQIGRIEKVANPVPGVRGWWRYEAMTGELGTGATIDEAVNRMILAVTPTLRDGGYW